ncbi:T9SS type A sorting domain-containing protein [Candidatus Pollutiaquabacter sp.]|uniref:T9SS type A sorting domain-containing protein n=1 Tax=Candidatus Pollutiaquabacter sp. TaxID=3416354 RepID=UPI003C9594C3|nr:T9SS type A sorting domain-containing protein [Bacteroidota bacterium]
MSFSSAVHGQQIGDVYVYDSTLSRFSDYDFDDQGNLLFSGYVRPRNTTGTDPFGNLSFDGYWYEDGLTCKADSTGFLQWMTVSGNNNAQENVQEIRFDNLNVFSIGKFIPQSNRMFVNGVSLAFPYPCCNGGYILNTLSNGTFVWAFPLPDDGHSLDIRPNGNIVASDGSGIRSLHTGSTQLWNVPIALSDSRIRVVNDTLWLLGMFQDSLLIGGTTYYTGTVSDADLFVARFTSLGDFIDARHLLGTGMDLIHDLAIDATGRVWISGMFGNDVDIDGTPVCGSGLRVGFLRMDQTLHVDHCEVVPLVGTATPEGVNGEMVFNSSNERIATINTVRHPVFGSDTVFVQTWAGYEGTCVLAKWDASGNLLWYRPLAEPVAGGVEAASVSGHIRKQQNGRWVLAGQMRETCRIDGQTYNASADYSAFFAYLEDTTTIATALPKMPETLSCYLSNPVTDRAVVRFEREPGEGSIQIFDATGRLVKAQSGRLAISETLDCSHIPSGVYLIQLTSGNRLATLRMVKQ